MANVFERFFQRALTPNAAFALGESFGSGTDAGVTVDTSEALTINTVWACVSLIADTISTLPMDAFYRQDGARYPLRPRPEWVMKPDVDLSRSAHFQQVLISLLTDGNAFVRIFRDPNDPTTILNLVCLDPAQVEVHRSAIGMKRFVYAGNRDEVLTSNEIMHITGSILMPGAVRAESPIDKLKENLGLAVALQGFAARFFGQGATTQGVIEYPDKLTREQARDLAEGFNSQHRGWRRSAKVGILSMGAKFNPTSVPNDQSQFLQSREMAVLEIARAYRVPPSKIGVVTPGAMSYASVESNQIQFVVDCLTTWIVKLEDAYSALLPRESFLKINVNGLLRGDFASRVAGYSSALQSGWLSIDDVRVLEDLRPIDNGGDYRVPLANVSVGAASLVGDEKKVNMAQKLIAIGFDPKATLEALGLPAIDHTGIPSVMIQPLQNLPTDTNYGA